MADTLAILHTVVSCLQFVVLFCILENQLCRIIETPLDGQYFIFHLIF